MFATDWLERLPLYANLAIFATAAAGVWLAARRLPLYADEICDRFCVLGNTEQVIEKLHELESVGVDQFNIYLMTGQQEATLEAYGKDIIPKFAGVAA